MSSNDWLRDVDAHDEREWREALVSVNHFGLRAVTDKALCFALEQSSSPFADQETVWVPKSLCDDYGPNWFYVPRWWAEEKGLDV